MPYRKITFFRKTFDFSNYHLAYQGKKDVWAIDRCVNRNISLNTSFANPSSNIFVDCREVYYISTKLEKIFIFFALSLACELIYNFAKSKKQGFSSCN